MSNVYNLLTKNLLAKLATKLTRSDPVDYSIWSALQQLVYRQKIEDVDHLKQVLNRCESMLSQELINGAIDRWSKRLSLVIHSHGGHIEHRFA